MAEKPTRAARVSVSPSDSRVQEKLAQKHAEAAEKKEAAMRAAFATPVEIAGVKLYPPNSQTFDAIYQPDLLQLMNSRSVPIIGFLISHPPSDQIALALDAIALRNAAAVWQDSFSSADWKLIYEQALKAWAWIHARIDTEKLFFSPQS